MPIAVFIHVLCGVVLTMTLVIMQLVVNPAISNVPAGEGKQKFGMVIQTRWHPVVDAAIIGLTVTAIIFLVFRWGELSSAPIMHAKITFGIIVLTFVNLLHFYYRGVKRKLKAAGDTEKLATANKLTAKMEKGALIFGLLTFLSALLYNHSPF